MMVEHKSSPAPRRRVSQHGAPEISDKRVDVRFPEAVFKGRRERLAELLEARHLDGYFLSNEADLYYLTGFLSEGFYGLATRKGMWLFASALLAGQVREHAKGCHLVVGKRLTLALNELKTKYKLKRIGFDPEQVNFRLGSALMKSGLTMENNPTADLRVIKDREELGCLSRACQITADSIFHIKKKLRVGITEKQLAVELQVYFYKRGAEREAFDLIVAMGPHTALPHHIPGERRLKRGEPVLFDIGCTVGGYRSDLTRTLEYGKIPGNFKRIFNIVQSAQRAGMERARPQSTGGHVDAAARSVISRAGFARYFVHSTGHGVGIDIHEPPWVRAESPDILKPGMIITVEPGIYLPGKYGVRIEDTMLITPEGHEVLTTPS